MGYKSEESQALLAPREVVASQSAVAVAVDDATAERNWDGACYQVCGPQCDSTGVSSCALAYLMPCVAFGCVIPFNVDGILLQIAWSACVAQHDTVDTLVGLREASLLQSLVLCRATMQGHSDCALLMNPGCAG